MSGTTDYSVGSVPKYVQHSVCGGIVEVVEDEDDPSSRLTVFCHECDREVEPDELASDNQDEEALYLVWAPR